MSKSILEYLSEVPDKRRKQGQRYPLDKMLGLILLGTFAGRVGYRAISRFGKEHESYLTKVFNLKHGTPSHVSLTAIVEGVEFEDVEKAVNDWSKSKFSFKTKKNKLKPANDRVIALDGKAIKASVKNGTSKSQNFIAFVNAFCAKQEHVLSGLAYENGKASEQANLRKLVKTLGVEGAIFTMDALHDSKKR